MATLFISRPGQVSVARGDIPVPATLFLEGWDGFPTILAAITGYAFNTKGAVQVRPTLGNWLSLFVFGEDPGTLTITGTAFTHGCETDVSSTGVDQLLAFYNANRATRTGRPMTIQIGLQDSSRLRGLLSAMRIESASADLQLSQFQLLFTTLPLA
jgi:hypothetical protein